ncbi:hypothetical protein V6N11_001175 [Hibiscus sabdariffa]|uniref:Uncharacterized protein n=1 Tax=Hibiscus sabdariffa TaxID=183260 RepID=A0ABR2RZ01_9ROSI
MTKCLCLWCQAFAIGSRSQAAKTYLERRFESFTDASHDDLVKDDLMATVQQMIDAFEIVGEQEGPVAKPEQGGAAAGEGVAPMDI